MGLCRKKQKNCDPLDISNREKGDQWDHTAIDVDSRLVISLVIGKRTGKNLDGLINDFAQRTEHIPPALITTDDCSTYDAVLLRCYGKAPKDHDPSLEPIWPTGSVHATVKKSYKEGSVDKIKREITHGTQADLEAALLASSNSSTVNTSFVERQNGTDRNFNARKRRKTYEFSKSLLLHIAVSWWVYFCYNFHHTNRALRLKIKEHSFLHRTPAMAAGLKTAPMTIPQILSTQIVGFIPYSNPKYCRDHSLLSN